MLLTNPKQVEVREKLISDFLYGNDFNSIQLLLNIYNLENNIRSVYPNYISLRELRRDVASVFREKDGIIFVSSNLTDLIHEDLNRLELIVYIEGYKNGFESHRMVNLLENTILKNYSVAEIYEKKHFIQYDFTCEDLRHLRDYVCKCVGKEMKSNGIINYTVLNYINTAIRPKVYHLNKYTDKQLSLDYASNDIIDMSDDTTFLTKEELRMVYRRLIKFIQRNISRLYKQAYWSGMNDRLRIRYR